MLEVASLHAAQRASVVIGPQMLADD